MKFNYERNRFLFVNCNLTSCYSCSSCYEFLIQSISKLFTGMILPLFTGMILPLFTGMILPIKISNPVRGYLRFYSLFIFFVKYLNPFLLFNDGNIRSRLDCALESSYSNWSFRKKYDELKPAVLDLYQGFLTGWK